MQKQSKSLYNLIEAIDHYEIMLKNFRDASSLPTIEDITELLLLRDNIQFLIRNESKNSSMLLLRLNNLDEQLKNQSPQILTAVQLPSLRSSVLPTESAWWWFLDDQKDNKHDRFTDKLLYIAAGTFSALTLTLALEVIKRFWMGAPDSISVWGTLLAVLLTASPFVKSGQKIFQGLLKKISFIKPDYQSVTMAILSGIALSVLMVIRLWLIPGPLTTYYNNKGVTAQKVGNLNLSLQMYQRAAALNPDRAVPYYNLAESYEKTGLNNEAEKLFQQSIESDTKFTPAYRGLSELYNQQENYLSAESVSLGGLNVLPNKREAIIDQVTYYELLSNLGWSYWGQKKLDLAKSTLEKALELEPDLKKLADSNNSEYRLALPHYYLALIYEETGDLTNAQQQWEESLRFLDQNDWRQQERYMITLEHLQTSTNK